MHVDHLEKCASELTDFLRTSVNVSYEYKKNAGRFIDIYHEDLPGGSGVYLFHFDDGEVFYIGKTEAERNDFTRIWHHLHSAKVLDTGVRGFPDSRFVADFDVGSKEAEAVRNGHFRIDFLIVEPKTLTSLYEVYLQTVCQLFEGRPKSNRRIG